MTTPSEIAAIAKRTRLGLAITQEELAMAAGTGLRFIKDLERGKPTCEIGKALEVLSALGIRITLAPPLQDVNRQAQNDRELA
jgi:HTH-type transcriptional regulator/antitoxin HipB